MFGDSRIAINLAPCCEERLRASTFVTACWLDSHKNGMGPGSRTTPNTVVLALHFSVGNGDDRGFSGEAATEIGSASSSQSERVPRGALLTPRCQIETLAGRQTTI